MPGSSQDSQLKHSAPLGLLQCTAPPSEPLLPCLGSTIHSSADDVPSTNIETVVARYTTHIQHDSGTCLGLGHVLLPPISQQVLWVQSIARRRTQLPEVTVNVGEWQSVKVTFEPSGESIYVM